MFNKISTKIKNEALSITVIILLVMYVFISYKTYVIQQNRLEVERLAYQLELHLEELEYQNDCMDRILEILEAHSENQ